MERTVLFRSNDGPGFFSARSGPVIWGRKAPGGEVNDPAEIPDARLCRGPWLALGGGEYCLDVSRNSGAMGIGFQSGTLYGALQFAEAWTGDSSSGTMQRLMVSFASLLVRKAGWERARVSFHPSPDEAIPDTECLSLATDMKGLEWPDWDCDGLKAEGWDSAVQREWTGFWHRAGTLCRPGAGARVGVALERASPELPRCPADGPANRMAAETRVLESVAIRIREGGWTAVCLPILKADGGDSCCSLRFFLGLRALTAGAGVRMICDETASGFHLGREFFWHRQFPLTGEADLPDAVVCGPPGGVGVRLERLPSGVSLDARGENAEISGEPEFHPGNLAIDCILAHVLDQQQEKITGLEKHNRERLSEFCQAAGGVWKHPRCRGLGFSFDCPDSETRDRFLTAARTDGVWISGSGSLTVAGRLNTAFSESDLEHLWGRMGRASGTVLGGAGLPGGNSPMGVFGEGLAAGHASAHVHFASALIACKRRGLSGRLRKTESVAAEFVTLSLAASGISGCEVVSVSADNWQQYRGLVERIQGEVYEPARQTATARFDSLVAAENSHSLLVLREGGIIAMAFAGPLALFADEKGTIDDPSFEDPSVLYMLDLTVREPYRGVLGRIMKQAITLSAAEQGCSAIHGRNRDRLAGAMWSINLGLGSFQTRHLRDDYPDRERYRDCIYYRCPLQWEHGAGLCGAVRAPLDPARLSMEFVEQELAERVTRFGSSGLAGASQRERFREVRSWLVPAGSSGWFTASSLSAAVQQTVRLLARRSPSRSRLVRFAGHWFGSGNATARMLSGLAAPSGQIHTIDPADMDWIRAFGSTGDPGNTLAVFIEPLAERNLRRMKPERLSEFLEWLRQHSVPVVFQETASQGYRYDASTFSAAELPGLRPDIGLALLGPQLAFGWVSEHRRMEAGRVSGGMEFPPERGRPAPDGASLATYHESMRQIRMDLASYRKTVERFQGMLVEELRESGALEWDLAGGVGSFLPGRRVPEGKPDVLRVGSGSWLDQFAQSSEEGRRLVFPSWGQVLRYVGEGAAGSPGAGQQARE